MKAVKLIAGVVVSLAIIVLIAGLCLYSYGTSAYNKNAKDTIAFTVSNDSTYYSIVNDLYDTKLIKSKFIYRVYLKLNPPHNTMKAGTYNLSQSMNLKEIIETLGSGETINPNEVKILFQEGLNMRSITKLIVSNTNNTEEDVNTLLKNKDYLKDLINTYWFIDKSILNEDIYYSLEGYLFPNTYTFENKDVTVKEIFKAMLDETEKQLEPYKEEIEKSGYSAHEILTLASIVELEAVSTDDRKEVAGIFFNRLKNNMSLGSDVTTYYGAKIDMGTRDLYQSEIKAVNAYNTRADSAMAGKLPIGPICNPSLDAIKAVLEPNKTNKYYFVADKNGKVYYMNTYQEHENKIAELKAAGLWF